MLKTLRRKLGSWKRVLVTFQEHGKATRHAHYMYLHYIPYNDFSEKRE